ncbi:hypothetical protein VNI00_004569 [Paramarasmius palmivorus]|uniref:DUF6534 domain-containing protein n=1 Tax=Paramarasmius palmivorus TaxID=297713 RepID=A0AAW0DHW5_9AGAR
MVNRSSCTYCSTYKQKDPWAIRCLVLLLFIANSMHCLFIVVYLHDSLIKHYDDPSFLTRPVWTFMTEPALAGIVSGLVQAFFGWRVKVLTGSWALFIIIGFCSVAAFFMGIAAAIATGIIGSLSSPALQQPRITIIIWLVNSTLADIIITCTLVYHLQTHKTGFKSTDSHLDRIIRLTIQTGLVTTIWALTDLLVYLLLPDGTHLIFNCVLPKLYTISLLSSLNSRGGWRYNTNGTTSMKPTESQDNHIGLRRVFVHVESEATVEPPSKGDSIFGDGESNGGLKAHVSV